MPTRKLLIIPGLLLMAIAAFLLNPESQPRYQGRTLTQWLHTPPPLRYDEVYNLSAEARAAIRAIGTDAIPAALRWISYEPPALKQKVRPLANLLPQRQRPRFLTIGDRRAIDAENLFFILGPEARSVVPDLVRLAVESKGDARVGRCARSLEVMGPEGLAGLIAIAENPKARDRGYVIERFLAFGPGAAPAVPTLLTALQDRDPTIAFMAATTPGMLELSNTTVVPVAINTLQHTNPSQRLAAAVCLSRYRTAASNATPALHRALADPDPSVRSQAEISLRYITNGWTDESPGALGR